MKKHIAVIVAIVLLLLPACSADIQPGAADDSTTIPAGTSGGNAANNEDSGFGGSVGGGGVAPDGGGPVSYAGPVFPLSVLDNAEGLTATRDIIFDFNDFWVTEQPFMRQLDIKVTDRYVLTNETADDITAKIVYPFPGSFSDFHRQQPTITIGGNTVETELLAGPYCGGFTGSYGGDNSQAMNLKQIGSWEDYIPVLSDGEYLKQTLGTAADLNQIVTVYEFSNVNADFSDAAAPTLAASFNYDSKKTFILSYGFNGVYIDGGFMRQSFFIPQEGSGQETSPFILIVVGDDIANLTINGYKDGSCSEGMEATADVSSYQTMLGDALAPLLDNFIALNSYDAGWLAYETKSSDLGMLRRAVAEMLRGYGALSENTIPRYGMGQLDDIFNDLFDMDRIFYLVAEISVPAGESDTLSADMIKPGSINYYGTGTGDSETYGYDMLTQLGSDLEFSKVTAGISGAGRIVIVRQNFGFDPQNGVLNVTLDPQEPHYYLNVSRRLG